MISKKEKVLITGHGGMLGARTLDVFRNNGYENILTATHSELDLKNQDQVDLFFSMNRPKYVIHLAAKVGGINANINNPATFLYDNLMINSNVIHAAQKYNVEKFVFLGSSCIYPRECPQPMKEEYLLTGKLEPTNEGYAIGKIAGIKLIEAFNKQFGFNGISLMPSNLYGPNDSFDLNHAHVLSSLVKRFVDAKDNKDPQVVLWGTGAARREFLHVDDCSRAILFFFENYDSPNFINIGPGNDISIEDLANYISTSVGYKGKILWDKSKPNGMLRKCMDVSNMKKLGFSPLMTLEKGIKDVIKNYKKQKYENTINA
jgi:GDP-L-fucose synthase